MATQDIKNIYKAVCEAPSGSGFHIDHMPDFLYKGDIDDGMPHVHTFDTTPYYVIDDGTAVQFQASVERMEEKLKTGKGIGHCAAR